MNQNDIEAMIQRYTEAEMAVLDGKSVTFNGQQMTMENLSEIRQGRQEWERRLAALITRRRGHPGNPDDVKRRRKAEIDENRKLDLVFDTDPASDKGGSSAATKRQEPQHTDDQSEE